MTKPNIINRIANKIGFEPKKGNKAYTAPTTMSRIRQDAKTRLDAIAEAELPRYPYRVKLQRLYLNTGENGFVKACVERRKNLTLLRKWKFETPAGEADAKTLSYFFDIDKKGNLVKKQWFNNFISYVLDAQYYGYTLIFLGDIENTEFKGTEVIKRWHVSPDRLVVSRYEYIAVGDKFTEDENLKDFHVYVDTPNHIGTSKCGYGLFYEVSVYENLLRNVLGLNADYCEVNIAPFRQIKTIKTEEAERNEIFQAAINMASNGVALTDPEDEIIFHPTGSGTGYNAFDLFDKRLKAEVSQLILGHADAMSSIPGKLGNDGGESPAQQALEDKQTIDGEFVTPIVNKLLFAKMRALGFPLPEGLTASLQNDNESVENANNIIAQAKEMKSGGLQMDPAYFTAQTNIPVVAIVPDVPAKGNNLSSKIENRLKEIYG